MTTLQDIMDTTAFVNFVRDGLITERSHPDDDLLRIYSYGKKVQHEGLWTPETTNARGLMLQLPTDGDYANAIVVGRGLPKFFTIEQVGSDWGKAKLVDDDENVTFDETPEIPWDEPAIVSDKLNGALALGYIQPDGSFTASTKGSFGSLEAAVSDRILHRYDREGVGAYIATHGVTPLFEVITPERPHPVNYGDHEDLEYLGLVDIATGAWAPADSTHVLVKEFGFSFAPVVEHGTLREAVEAPYRPNTEGLVVTVPGHGLYKVKPEEYLQLRRVFYASRPKDMIGLVENMDIDHLYSITSPEQIDIAGFVNVPENEHNREMMTERKYMVFHDMILPIQQKATDLTERCAQVMQSMTNVHDRGEYARLIRTERDQGALFTAYDDALTGDHRIMHGARKIVLQQIKKGK